MKSRVFSSKLMKNNISGALWIPILLSIGFLFTFPIATLQYINRYVAINYTASQMQILAKLLYQNDLLVLGSFIITGAAFLNALQGFFYLYSREKVDFYHSLPIRRRSFFLQKALTGFTYTMIPYGFLLCLSLLVTTIRGYFSSEILILSLLMMLKHMLVYLFLYFCFVLVFSMTGNILMGVLSIGGFFLYGPAMFFVLLAYQSEAFSTYTGINSMFDTTILRITPFTVLYELGSRAATSTGFLLLTVFLTILMGSLSYLAYVRRPSEATGKSVVYPWFATLLKYMIVIPCGLGIGLIMYTLQPTARNFWGIFGILFGTLLSKGLMEVLYTFDFRSFLKNKYQILVSLLVIAAIISIFRFDLIGYNSYLPAYEKLAGVSLSLNEEGMNNYPVSRTEDGLFAAYYDMESEYMYRKNESEIGEALYLALQKIVETNPEAEHMEETHGIRVKYHLKSGGSVFRSYQINEENTRALFRALYEESNFKEIQASALRADAASYLLDVDGIFLDGNDYQIFPNMPEKQAELAEAIREDYFNASAEELLNQKIIARVHFSYNNVPFVPESIDYVLIPGEEYCLSGFWCECNIYPSYQKTIALLRETGFPLGSEELNIRDADIRISMLQDDEYKNYGPFLFTEEKIKEIQPALHLFSNHWEPQLNEVYVLVSKTQGAYEDSVAYHFNKDDVPACIQTLLDKIAAGELEEIVYE